MDARTRRNSSEAFRYEDDGVEAPDDCSPPAEHPDMTDSAAGGSASDELSIDEILAEADAQSKRDVDEASAESDFAETWNLDATQELLAPEELFSSEDLEGKI